MSAQSEDESTAEANIENIRRSSHPHYNRNFLASPLLRLPTELILKIFKHAIEPDDSLSPSRRRSTLFVLIAICHKMREIGITTSHLWNTVNLAVPPLAKLFLERCNYDPRVLIISKYPQEGQSRDPRREAVWEQLEGLAFNNLRSLVFEGTTPEFERRIVPILQKATNLSSLDFQNTSILGVRLPWHPSDPIPRLSTLHLRGISVPWTSPLLRNLNRLTLDLGLVDPPSARAPIETFLAALANCPDLESLEVARAGQGILDGHQSNRAMVVQLHRLQRFHLEFNDPPTVRYLLSHIEYPESAWVRMSVAVGWDADISETIYQVLPRGNADTLRYFRKTETLITYLSDVAVRFAAGKSTIHCRNQFIHHPQALSRFAAKFLEVIGKDTLTLFTLKWGTNLTEGMWEAVLHGLPRLERFSYWHCKGEGSQDVIDSFVLVFSQPFEGAPVLPQLQCLYLPRDLFTQDASATLLKRALAERVACGRRLKRIGLSDVEPEEGDGLVLGPFRELGGDA